MRHTEVLSLLAGAAVSLCGASVALADVEATPAGAKSADEVRAIVAEMLADAETRSSLLQSGAGIGHDGRHFFMASGDGNFRLNVGGQIQFRYIFNLQDKEDQPEPEDPEDIDFLRSIDNDDFVGGFQTRRTKLTFSGNVFEPELFYRVQGEFDRADGDIVLEDAYVGYDMGNGWQVRWGQFKLPFLREELVSSAKQLAVERSITNEIFNQDRGQGIEGSYTDEAWRVMGSFSDGFFTANSDFADPAAAEYAFTGRFEFMFGGEWSQWEDFTSPQGSEELGIMLGGAAHFEQTDNNAETQRFNYTIDVSVEGDGWNLFGAFTGSDVTDGTATGIGGDLFVGDSTNFGYVIQGGVYLGEDFEIFGRWDGNEFDDDLDGPDAVGDDTFNTLTAGVNYYLHGHAAKFTADVVYFIDETPESFVAAGTGSGLFAPADDGQFAIRLQFQLLF